MRLTAPLATTARLTKKTVRAGVRVSTHLALTAVERIRPGSGDEPTAPPVSAFERPTPPSAPRRAEPTPSAGAAAPAPDVPSAVPSDVSPPITRPDTDPMGPPSQPEFEPPHLEEVRPELVREDADEGYGEGAGAGANLTIGVPWDGYDGMTAADIADRLAVADAATLAAVRLYESGHRDRKTVIQEVDRRLATAG